MECKRDPINEIAPDAVTPGEDILYQDDYGRARTTSRKPRKGAKCPTAKLKKSARPVRKKS